MKKNDVNETLVIDSVIIIKAINNSSVNNTSIKSGGISFPGNSFLVLFHYTATLSINNNATNIIEDLLSIKVYCIFQVTFDSYSILVVFHGTICASNTTDITGSLLYVGILIIVYCLHTHLATENVT